MKRATEILSRVRTLDDTAAEALFPLVYAELHRVASSYMDRERDDHTLQPTALIHEAYFKLIGEDDDDGRFTGRAHFLGIAARAMRQILVDHARKRDARKRGGAWQRVTLEGVAPKGLAETELIEIDEALERLAEHDTRLSRVVELRYFGGLTLRETATVIGVARSTVDEDWALARAWLARELAGDMP